MPDPDSKPSLAFDFGAETGCAALEHLQSGFLRSRRGAGARSAWLLTLALFLLVASTVIVGYGNYLGMANAVH